MRAIASYPGSSSSAETAGCSRPYSSTRGVTTALVMVTSPLGKLWLPPPLNQRLGSEVWSGRSRENTRFNTTEDTPPMTVASMDCRSVRPTRSSPPSHQQHRDQRVLVGARPDAAVVVAQSMVDPERAAGGAGRGRRPQRREQQSEGGGRHGAAADRAGEAPGGGGA